jgi:hypothetical protein
MFEVFTKPVVDSMTVFDYMKQVGDAAGVFAIFYNNSYIAPMSYNDSRYSSIKNCSKCNERILKQRKTCDMCGARNEEWEAYMGFPPKKSGCFGVLLCIVGFCLTLVLIILI